MGRPQEVSPKNGVADDDDVRKIFVMSKAELVAMRKSLKLAQKESATKKRAHHPNQPSRRHLSRPHVVDWLQTTQLTPLVH